MTILLTGAAGFIGYHVAKNLAEQGADVLCLDSVGGYGDGELKEARVDSLGVQVSALDSGQWIQSSRYSSLQFIKCDLEDEATVMRAMASRPLSRICHLAAQAGVRRSLENPRAFIDSNVSGFLTVLELARLHKVAHLAYASSSSVYGDSATQPLKITQSVDAPVSLYAATKKANELMAHSYAHLYGLPVTGLRFFTVYGPWGRPDMAYFKFVRRILAGEAIDVYNHGDLSRDFTYVDDIVEGVTRVLFNAVEQTSDRAPYRLYNLGNGNPVRLLDFIEAIESALGERAKKRMLPMQPGDVLATWADTSRLERDYGFRPGTPLNEGVARFVAWYREFYGV